MRLRLALLMFIASFALAAPAWAGDPTMPLSAVQPGMQCTGYSVISGTAISSFNVTVLTVVDGDPTEGPRILVQVSGPAVDATGVGPGFSGSPIYCPDGQGTMRVIGAISESIGSYGNKVVLATPIEQILAEPLSPPTGAVSAPALLRAARPLADPLTISGLSPRLLAIVGAAAHRAGRTVLTTPAGPLGSFPPQTLQPGSAFSVGLSSGDVAVGAIGTVTYVNGGTIWGFGHPLDDTGRRSLLLQDAYVYGIIANPNSSTDQQTYKLAAPGHDLGTLSDDANNAVVGQTGALPDLTTLQVIAQDADRGTISSSTSMVADEQAVGLPDGSSALGLVGALAISQAVGNALDGQPAKESGRMCVKIGLRESIQPLGFCNRYVVDAPTGMSQSAASSGSLIGLVNEAANDLASATALLDAYRFGPIHVSSVSVFIKVRRGLRQGYLLAAELPARVRRGQLVRVRLLVHDVAGGLRMISARLRVPRSLAPGRHLFTFTGSGEDAPATGQNLLTLLLGAVTSGSSGAPGGDPGPQSIDDLAAAVNGIERFDGITVTVGPRLGTGARGGRRMPTELSVGAFTNGAERVGGSTIALTQVLR